MRALGLGELPPDALERRRRLGQDRYDEVWEGTYRMVPGPRPAHGIVEDQLAGLLRRLAEAAGLIGSGPFNLGAAEDYRVPDRGYHRAVPTEMYVPTAALVVEVLSPDDGTWAKFGFYAAHGVDELLIADPDERTVRVWQRRPDGQGYDEVTASALLDVSAHTLAKGISWPNPRPIGDS